MTARITFDVAGKPIGQAAIRHSANGHGYYPNRSELEPWKHSMADAAAEAMAGREALGTPVEVWVNFRLARPAGHFGKHGRLPSAPEYPAKRPDLDHLVRALDALTGIVWRDDAQVIRISASKTYGQPGVTVEVAEVLP